jgi:hypothetical protein
MIRFFLINIYRYCRQTSRHKIRSPPHLTLSVRPATADTTVCDTQFSSLLACVTVTPIVKGTSPSTKNYYEPNTRLCGRLSIADAFLAAVVGMSVSIKMVETKELTKRPISDTSTSTPRPQVQPPRLNLVISPLTPQTEFLPWAPLKPPPLLQPQHHSSTKPSPAYSPGPKQETLQSI